ncbi:MAG: lipocalin family protein [Halioglobus sp.]
MNRPEGSLRWLIVAIIVSLAQLGCSGTPQGIKPVDDFQLDRYLGTWYEIARLDHSFERGLSRVTADYSIAEDGGVRVLNRGFSQEEQEWNVAQGKAYFVGDDSTGHLKVSFFGPFYGSYVIFDLDKTDYQYAFVTSYSKDYLWFLSRTPTVSDDLLQRFMVAAQSSGFSTGDIIFVAQEVSDTNAD